MPHAISRYRLGSRDLAPKPLRGNSVYRWLAIRIYAIAIVLLFLGGTGGSYQPSRLLVIPLGIIATLFVLNNRRHHNKIEAITILFCSITLIFGAFSLLWTPDFESGLNLLITVSIGLLAVLTPLAFARNLSSANLVSDAWSWSLAATLPWALYELATGNHFSYLGDRSFGGELSDVKLMFASVFFGNWNNYSLFICLCLPFLLGTAERSSGLMRNFWVLCGTAALTIIVINTSRASLLFVTLLFLCYMMTRNAKYGIALLAVSSVFATLAISFLPNTLSQAFWAWEMRFTQFGLGNYDESNSMRWSIIVFSMERMSESFWAGPGIGGIEYLIERDRPDLIPNVHNLLVEFLVSFGPLPTLVFLLLLARVLWSNIGRNLPQDLTLPVFVGIPALPILGAIQSQNIGYTLWWFWFGTLIYLSICQIKLPRRQDALRGDMYSQQQRTGRA
jgi:hypothetical protein